MNRTLVFPPEPFPAGVFERFGTSELEAHNLDELGWEGEVSRTSPAYIRWVQSSLNKILGLRLAVDGISGAQTRSGIRSFQGKYRLAVDGIVGPQTEGALVSAGAGTPPGGSSQPTYPSRYPRPVPPATPGQGPAYGATRAQLASRILSSGRIELWPYSPTGSGRTDGADARSNMLDTAAGKAARRSSYDNAPSGTVYLDERLLTGLLELANHYSFLVTSIAGGSHSKTSLHYAGIACDVGTIDGIGVSASNPHYRAFMQKCRDLGATEVLGPGSAGHDTHIHFAWPRP